MTADSQPSVNPASPEGPEAMSRLSAWAERWRGLIALANVATMAALGAVLAWRLR